MATTKILLYSERPDGLIPRYETEQSAGMDLPAMIPNGEEIILKPFERKLIHTGLYIQLAVGYEAQVRPRSGLALKKGITVLNTPGTIDADYRGEIGVILINLSNEDFHIKNAERIAQMIISKHEQADFTIVNSHDDLEKTERGTGCFGHTGVTQTVN